MNQMTLRGFDKRLARRIREEAKARGVLLNQAALSLLRQGAGLAPAGRRRCVGDSMKELIGAWSDAEDADFRRAVRPLEEADAAGFLTF